jgi:hypothetical protein
MINITTAAAVLARRLAVAMATIAAIALSAPALASATHWESFPVTANPDGAGGCIVGDVYGDVLGKGICGTKGTRIHFNDGRVHTYIIGTDHAVWNIINYAGSRRTSGWQSLQGWALQEVTTRWANSANDLGIWTWGWDGRRNCNNYQGRWTGWFGCRL